MSLAESPHIVGPVPLGLPMPPDRTLLDPATPRVRVRTGSSRFPFPIPHGWFAVAVGAELAPGAVLARHYFGRDLAVYRGEDGAAHVVDAYCAHLGAHLAAGGKVRGGRIVCPFHGWCYDGQTGRCVEIPYADGERIPARASVRAYPVVERNGLVFAWYHRDDGEPFYEVPELPEVAGDPGWHPPQLVEFRLASSCQELVENSLDHTHFRYVHGDEVAPPTEEVFDGAYCRVASLDSIRESFGLGVGTVRVPDVLLLFAAQSPIDDENVHVRWVFTAPVADGDDDAIGRARLDRIINRFADGVAQDIPIWENKVYRERPLLTQGEASIATYRRWCQQYYG
jgi:phenylpropionate dioxygenase-like ring-hydroxylating dioxygenase large terminal subunit